jgi:ankyrin repeat protein
LLYNIVTMIPKTPQNPPRIPSSESAKSPSSPPSSPIQRPVNHPATSHPPALSKQHSASHSLPLSRHIVESAIKKDPEKINTKAETTAVEFNHERNRVSIRQALTAKDEDLLEKLVQESINSPLLKGSDFKELFNLTIKSRNEKVLESLLNKVDNVSLSKNEFKDILHAAIRSGNKELLRSLLNKPQAQSLSKSDLESLLMISTDSGKELVESLLSDVENLLVKFGNESSTEVNFKMLIYLAVSKGDEKLLQFLLEQKPELANFSYNNNTQTLLNFAKENNNSAIINILEKAIPQ